MKRRLYGIILATALLFSCAACGEDDSAAVDSKKPSQSQVTSSSATVHTHSWSDWTENPDDASTETRTCECGESETRAKSATPKGVYYGSSAGYSDWLGSDGTDIRDINFNIVYTAVSGEEIEVLGGSHFISKIGDVQYLKKYNGTEICSTESLGITGFGMNDNYEDYSDFLEDGYVFCYKTVETYSKVTYEIGILGVDGKWIVPLSDKHPIISSGMELNNKVFSEKMRYCGDGVITLTVNLSDYDYKYMLYNIKKNATYRYKGDKVDTMSKYLLATPEFSNGFAHEQTRSTYFSLSSTGEVKTTELIPSSTHCSTIYGTYADGKGNYYSLISNGWNMQLCSTKKVIKDFKDVDILNAKLLGDKWLISIKNSENTCYYTLLKTDGSFAFEPIKTTASIIFIENGEKMGFFDDITTESNSGSIVINNDGEIVYEIPSGVAEFSIKNGVICEDDSYKFLPKK